MSSEAITGCHHVAICVRDLDEARRFYGEVIALDEIERPAAIADQFRSVWFRLGSTELHIVESAEFEPFQSPLAPHIAVVTRDFDAVIKGIEERGGKFLYGPAQGPDGNTLVVLKDPTGNNLEITTAPVRE